MIERTQPTLGGKEPEPAVAERPRQAVPPDRLGTHLSGVTGLYQGHLFLLSGEVNLLGRDASCQIALHNDMTVSRVHARIVLEDSGHMLYDEGSANGTYVNGALVRACLLAPGDVIQCGSTRLKYE